MSNIDYDKIREQLKKREEERTKNSGVQFNWVNMPDDGEIGIRFLPPVHDASLPGIVVSKHYDIPERGSINCLAPYDIRCPICEVLNKFSDKISVDNWMAAPSSYFNVLVKGDREYDENTVYLMRSSEYTYYWLLEQIINPDVGDITDPKTGSKVTFKRKSYKGAFDRIIARQSVPIAESDEAINKILESTYNLQEIWKVPDTIYINTAIEFAKSLENEIKRRLQEIESSEYVVKEDDVPDTPPLSETDQSQPVENNTTKSTDIVVPPGAPECYGKEHDDNSHKCMLCHHEFNCSKDTANNLVPF